MELDPVTEEFLAQTGPWVEGITAAIEATKALREQVNGLHADLDALPREITVHVNYDTRGAPEAFAAGAGAGMAGQAREARDAFAILDDALAEYDGMLAQATAREDELRAAMERASGDAGAQSAVLRDVLAFRDEQADAMRAASEAAYADAAAQEALGASADRAGQMVIQVDNSVRNYNRTLNSSADTSRNAARLWGVMPLTWNAIHWAITGTAEALAVIIPAMVAAGSAAAVGLQGAADAADRMKAVYQATEATYSYLGKTVSTGLGQGIDSFTASAGQAAGAGNRLRDSLQQAQNAAQPHVYELLGAAVDGANSKFGVFNTIGSQTIGMLDQFAAKIDIELAGPLGNLGQAIGANAVTDLQGLGQVFGNLGHAVAYAAGEMPGMANLLLTILDDGTQVLDWALHFQGVLETLFLAHEAYMWGGLVQKALTGVTGALASGAANLEQFAGKALLFDDAGFAVEDAASGMSTALKGAASFLSGPWGLAIGAGVVAMALLLPKLLDAKDATQQWISSMEQQVAQAQGLQQIAATYNDLQAVTRGLSQAQVAYGQAVSSQNDRIIAGVRGLAGAVTQVDSAAQNVRDLSAAQQQLSQDWATELSNVQYLSSAYKISYVDAAQLASDAGISLTQTLKGNSVAAQEARQMITNLIAGYGGMASVGSELGQDINAVSLAAEIQNGNVGKLNQAWDTFISTVQAPSSTFLSFAQSLAQFSQDAGQAGATMEGLGGSYTTATHNVDQAAVQLQQDFNSSVSSAEQMLDSMRTVAAVTGNGGPLTQGIKDTVAALIPMAGSNKAAQAQLFALAQEAGGPASGSMQALAKWTGSTKDPLTALYNLSMQASAALQNLGADTQALAKTVQSTLNQTLVTEAQNLTGVSGKTAIYLEDLQKFGPTAAVTQAALANLNGATSQSTTLASQAADGLSILNGKTQAQGIAAAGASGPQQKLNSDIQTLLNDAPTASGAVQNLVTAIENTGTKSQSSEGARSQLIKDLETAGVKAQTATGLVDGLITAIGQIPAGKTFTLTVQQREMSMVSLPGTSSVSVPGVTAPGVSLPPAGVGPGHAEGWHVPGYGGGDTVPAMLEPGEAVVPKHLVPAVAPFLGAHHVPGFAAGGRVANMSDVFALWAKEMWALDMRGHGRGHPIGEAAMKALLAAVTQPKRLSGIWDNPLWRAYARDLKADMGPYAGKDLEYWKILADEKTLKAAEKAKIAHDLHEIHLHELKHQPGWVAYYERQMHSLESADAKTLAGYAATLATLRREGFSSGGLVRSYDTGGYLPVGLSMAYNGTGRPEPVGARAGGGDVHVHLHGDLADDRLWDRMQAKTLDYGYLNSGTPAGVWQPGG